MEGPSTSAAPPPSETRASKHKEDADGENEWTCGKCSGNFTQDVRRKNGAKWIQCSFCLVPYHTTCQEDFFDSGDVYMCNSCETQEKESA